MTQKRGLIAKLSEASESSLYGVLQVLRYLHDLSARWQPTCRRDVAPLVYNQSINDSFDSTHADTIRLLGCGKVAVYWG
jgi:hypothetical protein